MGTTKTYLFSDEQYKIAIAISSFTHTARRTIIHHLLKVIACINSNLVQELSLVQATISQYASELKNIGIIQETIEETWMNYCKNQIRWKEIKDLFSEILNRLGGPIK